jgi:hypothetical protein
MSIDPTEVPPTGSRPVKFTPALKRAISALRREGRDGSGMRVRLCDGGDPAAVAKRLIEMADWYRRDSVFLSGWTQQAIGSGAKLQGVKNIQLLVAVLREHIKAGNV